MEIIRYSNFNESFSTSNQMNEGTSILSDNKSNYSVGVFTDKSTGKIVGKIVWMTSGQTVKCDMVFWKGELNRLSRVDSGVAKGGGYDRKTASFFDWIVKADKNISIQNENDMEGFLEEHGYSLMMIF